MDSSKPKLSLANTVIKEFDEMEEKRRQAQYEAVLNDFRRNAKEGNGYMLYYYAILYDEVRERLEQTGFNVEILTCNASGKAAYHISRRKDFIIDENLEKIEKPAKFDADGLL